VKRKLASQSANIGARRVNPALGCQNKTVQPRLFSNPIEFDGIKTWVVQPLPKAQELNRVPIPHPILDEVIRPLTRAGNAR
jgi:hypothetical protein